MPVYDKDLEEANTLSEYLDRMISAEHAYATAMREKTELSNTVERLEQRVERWSEIAQDWEDRYFRKVEGENRATGFMIFLAGAVALAVMVSVQSCQMEIIASESCQSCHTQSQLEEVWRDHLALGNVLSGSQTSYTKLPDQASAPASKTSNQNCASCHQPPSIDQSYGENHVLLTPPILASDLMQETELSGPSRSILSGRSTARVMPHLPLPMKPLVSSPRNTRNSLMPSDTMMSNWYWMN